MDTTLCPKGSNRAGGASPDFDVERWNEGESCDLLFRPIPWNCAIYVATALVHYAVLRIQMPIQDLNAPHYKLQALRTDGDQ